MAGAVHVLAARAQADSVVCQQVIPMAYQSYRNLPPLAGLCSMEQAQQSGLPVEECVRPQTTAASLAAMQPAFAELANSYAAALGRRVDHRHTFAHAPPGCDGASLALVGDNNSSRAPRARIVAYAVP